MMVHASAATDLSSPIGTWKTIDDKTGEARGIVRVYDQDGELFARIEQVLTPNDGITTCVECRDERRDQPLVGLVIIRHMRFRNGEYRDGDILDPETGSVYRCRFRLEDDGRHLRVRGFLGIALFGRTQIWERES